MAELGRDGHRKRAKQSFLDGAGPSMPDHNLLELLLFYSIPRRDVKPIAYNLINRFGSLKNVLCAPEGELMAVDGVGESTVILFKAIKALYERIELNKNKNIRVLENSDVTAEYAKNLLSSSDVERIVVISLNNNLGVINYHFVSSGTVNHTYVDPAKIIEYVLTDKAANVVIAHNHPDGDCIPSAADINFTLEIKGLLGKLGIRLIDHVIVTNDSARCMTSIASCANYF